MVELEVLAKETLLNFVLAKELYVSTCLIFAGVITNVSVTYRALDFQ